MPLVILCGAASINRIDNFGDQLLIAKYQNWVEEAVPNADTQRLSYDGVLNFRKHAREAIRTADLLVFVGGGYFSQKIFPGNNAVRNAALEHAWGIRNDSLYGVAFRESQRLAVPHIVSGVEVGPVRNVRFKRTIQTLFDTAEFASVRSAQSRDYLRSIGVRRLPAVHLDSALGTNHSEAARLSLGPKNNLRVGLHIHHMPAHDDRHSLLTLLDQVRAAAKIPVKFELVFDQLVQNKFPTAALEVAQRLEENPGVDRVHRYVNAEHLTSTLAELDLLVTTKLHAGIVMRSLSKPVISLGYQIKTGRFYQSIGESKFMVNPGHAAERGLPEEVIAAIRSACDGEHFPVPEAALQSVRDVKCKFQEAVGSTLLVG